VNGLLFVPLESGYHGYMRILLVEDYPSFVEIAVRALSEKGFEVTEVATDGWSALTALDDGEFDALVTDYELGFGPNGGDVALDALSRGLPLVVLWSSIPRGADELPDENMMKASGFHLLEKSDVSKVAELLRKLREHLDDDGA
jgi:CheY-like chemotaxis protein